MSDNNNENRGVLVGTKRVRSEIDSKGRKRTVLTFGPTKGPDGEMVDTASALIEALELLRGKQINFDVRVSEMTSERGTTFETAFVIVKEMIPKDATQTKFVPKNQAKASQAKATSARIKAALEE